MYEAFFILSLIWLLYPVVEMVRASIFPDVVYCLGSLLIIIGGLCLWPIGVMWNLVVLVFIFHSFSNWLILAISFWVLRKMSLLFL